MRKRRFLKRKEGKKEPSRGGRDANGRLVSLETFFLSIFSGERKGEKEK